MPLRLNLSIFIGLFIAISWADVRAEEVAFQDSHMLEALTEFPIYSFYLGVPAVDGVVYLPHTYPKVGPRLFIHGIGIAATFPIDLTHDDDLRGHSDQFSFILSPFRRAYGFDLYYQTFKGLYEDNLSTEFTSSKPARYPQLPNATVHNFGINSYFALTPSAYSLAAAFVQTEFQTASGGSFILEPFYNHVEINTGDTFTAGSDPSLPQAKPELQTATMSTYGLGIGYGQAWIDGRYYFSVLGGLGVGYQLVEVERADLTQFSTACAAAKVNFNLSTGLNFQSFVIGTKVLFDTIVTKVNGTNITATLASAQFYFGARF